VKLAPSILSFDLPSLADQIEKLAALDPSAIHMDIMDGQFVPPISFGDSFVAALRNRVPTLFEAHLMTLSPERQFESFQKAGCGRIIFHVEATVHSHRLVQQLKGMGLQAGVAINPGTPVEHLLPLIEDLDLALIMTVNPGWGGQRFLHSTLSKIRTLRALRADLLIEVDGGIEPETIALVKEAGANLCVVGSYLAKAKDIASAAAELEDACR
jgi:ribulose-phosphate 3-epimerase